MIFKAHILQLYYKYLSLKHQKSNNFNNIKQNQDKYNNMHLCIMY